MNEVSALDGFTPFDPDFAENPYSSFEQLRALSPVHHVVGLGYLISRYDDVLEVCRDPLLWSSRSGPSSVPDTPRIKELRAKGIPRVDTLLTSDPPDHRRYRSLVNNAFTPRRVALLEDRIRRLTADLIDGFAGQGKCELVHDYAVPVPLTIIAEQLGVPKADMARFKQWSDDSVLPLGGLLSEDECERCVEGQLEMERYFAAMIDSRRAAPRDDMLSDLIEAQLAGERPLDLPELLSILRQFLVAGNETTTKLIASAAMLLLRHPDQMELLRRDRSLAANALEESLRLESAVQTMFRTATRDTVIGDAELPAGSRVVLLIGAANRDPARFADPDRFDIRRVDARSHLGYAHGEHFCIGASLARAEATIAIDTLVTRLDDLRLVPGANDFRHERSFTHRGLRELHVEFSPHMEEMR